MRLALLSILVLLVYSSHLPTVPWAAPIVVSHVPLELLPMSEARDTIIAREARRQGVRRYGVRLEWILAISHTENWNGDSTAQQPTTGCVGLMQTCPYRYPSGERLWIGAYEEDCGPETDPPLVGRRRNVCVGLHVLTECIMNATRAVWSEVLACYGGATQRATRQQYFADVMRRFRLDWSLD